MKTISITLLMLVLATPGVAQNSRFVHDSGFRWYISPTKQISQVNGKAAISNGLNAGWIINDQITLGIAAHTLENNIKADRPHPDGAAYTAFFYSGITGTFSTWAMPRVQLTASALLGGGEAHWRDVTEGIFNRFERDDEHTTSFVAEPRIGASYFITPWMTVDASAGYRYVTGGKSNVVEQKDLRSFTGMIALRFGRF